ncbi:Mobile element protein [Candidatus Enterovibrio escicola]|uniref:Mobile element protein n=1 Tax=Candidatus Enterovibrio escicola TaxID=1927127 RepID=A0A2A5T2R2_9GAMM|nr:transposase [Candidatus Enterovibrio escacola]PCS22436.1 Mobile element protein [Candidatus Enterovibrio escacola]
MDDRKPISVMSDELWGCLYGDKGYFYAPFNRERVNKGVTLITGVKKHETQSDETLELPDTPETIYY